MARRGYGYRQMSHLSYGSTDFGARIRALVRSKPASANPDLLNYTPKPDISNYSPESRFKYVENLIIKLHKDSYERNPQRIDCLATFDDWKEKVVGFKARIHDAVVKYYAQLDFIKRYDLDRYTWSKDKDIVALIQILQIRGRAKAAAKLEQLEDEIDSIAAKIVKLESGGRYYREDVITLNATFDRLRITARIENDRGRKRQQSIDKVANAPFRVAEKAYVVGSNVVSVGCLVAILLAIPFAIIMIILGMFGVIR